MLFFVSLFVDGALAGSVYSLIALAFVVVYKASRVINFALGEWFMFASLLVAAGLHAIRLGLLGALVFACAGMVLLGLTFNRFVLRQSMRQRPISLIMVTLGLGAFLRGLASVLFSGIPTAIPLPLPREPRAMYGVLVSTDKVVSALGAVLCIGCMTWFFRRSRPGLALRAIADDQQAAMGVGIDLTRYFAFTWAMLGALSVLGGTLWTVVSGGGISVVLLGLKVFPIVIIGGLESISGTVVGAMLVGVLESLAAGYVDPLLGGGFSTTASYLVLIVVLFVRPYGIFGRPDVARI